MELLIVICGVFIFVVLLGIAVGKYLVNHSEEVFSEDIEKYFTQQDQDREFPNHNMNGGSQED